MKVAGRACGECKGLTGSVVSSARQGTGGRGSVKHRNVSTSANIKITYHAVDEQIVFENIGSTARVFCKYICGASKSVVIDVVGGRGYIRVKEKGASSRLIDGNIVPIL